ncbi:MAG: MFS transporter [Deltaproteobacteria bacterium]|nr:MFS transporter [Deltaproteobacteria bacterium]
MKYPAFVAENPRLALYAFLAIATSGFGQTFFVSVFGAGIRAEFALSNSSYGLYYGLATLGSALTLLKLGEVADRWDLWRVTLLAILLLATGCLLLGLAPGWGGLLPGFYLLRLGGQAMLSHLGMTVAGRYFGRSRGRIMALTAAGFPVAEASLPALAGLLLINYGWRLPWFIAAATVIFLALPLLLVLARSAVHPQALVQDQDSVEGSQMTRGQMLRDPGFYLVLPATLVTPFVITALLFHQVSIAALQGWSLVTVSQAFIGFALGHFASLFLAGPLIDRWSARRSLPVALLPLIAGLLVLGFSNASWTPYLYLSLIGGTLGVINTAAGAFWPERYGVRHVGAIRSVSQAAMVFSTAVAPLILGLLLDAGFSAATIGLLMAVLVGSCALLALMVRPLR